MPVCYTKYTNGQKSSLNSYQEFRWDSSDYGHPRTVLISEKIEGFHKRVEMGEFLPYTELKVSGQQQVGMPTGKSSSTLVDTRGNWDRREANACIMGISEPSYTGPSLSETEWQRLSDRAYLQAKRGLALLAVEIKEFPKVVSLFADFRMNLLRRNHAIQSHVRTINRKRSRAYRQETHEAFQQAWLEYRYGWRQLYFSAEAMSEAAQQLASEEKWLDIQDSASQRSELDVGPVQVTDLWAGSPYPIIDVVHKIQGTRTHRASCVLRMHKMTKAFNANPLLFAWEIVPYSFVVDWFVNTSEIIQAAWPSYAQHSTHCRSVKDEITVTTSYRQDVPPSSTDAYGRTITTAQGKAGRHLYRHQTYHRWPHPYVAKVPPLRLDVNLDWQKLLDIVALVTGDKPKAARI